MPSIGLIIPEIILHSKTNAQRTVSVNWGGEGVIHSGTKFSGTRIMRKQGPQLKNNLFANYVTFGASLGDEKDKN